jgi:hypothetical protein
MICSFLDRDRFVPTVVSSGGLQLFPDERQRVTAGGARPTPWHQPAAGYP